MGKQFIATTGYFFEQFNELLPFFEQAHTTYFIHYQIKGKRRTGICRFLLYANNPLLTVAYGLAFILSYFKLNPLQHAHADLFYMEQKQYYKFLHSLKTY
ncbi:MAG: hypothetical protein EOO61_22080 [Hymenobacter sp.]|nr:MAG: hypothetical protein EOO61_22080 [Hymenobacter sp.]